MSIGHGPYGRGDYGIGLYGTDESIEFPQGALRSSYEMLIGGSWIDVTPLVYQRESTVTTHGQADEGSSVDYAKMNFQLNNRDGVFSPRNPLSPYFGLLGRSTQIRRSVRYGPSRIVYTGVAAGGLSTADSAALDILGDIDIRVDGAMPSWYTAGDLALKYGSAGQRSWYFHIVAGGFLQLDWSADGTTILTAVSTVPVPWPATGRTAFRVTLDVNNGAAGNTTTFWYADDINAANGWTQLGSAVVKAGTTSIFNSTASLSLGVPIGREVFAVKVLSGIAGSTVVDADFRSAGDEDTSFTGATGESWVFGGHVQASNQHYRFWGEISALPVKWDGTGRDIWVSLQASGIIRRLGTRTNVLQSTLYRGITTTTDTNVVGYWPCEDGTDATSIAPAIGNIAGVISGTPTFQANSNYKASDALPTLNNSYWFFRVPGYTATSEFEVRFLLSSGAAFTTNSVIARVVTTGTAGVWELRYTTGSGGSLNLVALSNDGTTTIGSTGATAIALDGKDWIVALQMITSGADINAAFWIYEIGQDGYTGNSFVALGSTVGTVKYVQIDPNQNIDDCAIGHLYVGSIAITPVFATSLFDQVLAYAGRESAAGRVNRLCDEEGIALALLGFAQVGINDGSQIVGAQTQRTLLDLLREAEQADLGILYESTEELGLVYRPRLATYNRPVTATLSYSAVNLDDLEQVDDDQNVSNDVTVTRTGGSSFRAVQETGPLNVQDPTVDPAGVGRFPDPPTINVNTDDILPDHAGWRLHQGTVDEARYPVVQVNMTNQSLGPSENVVLDLLQLREGDRLVITDPRPDGEVDDISLVVLGWKETTSNLEWIIEFNCAPESSHRVGLYATDFTRYSSDGSELNESLSTSTTSFAVATPSGPVWAHDDGDYDINIGGERMTVTGVTGSTSPQTFTVTRSVNGIVKAHTIGDTVALWTPAYYGF
jgi:hypothetical protein